MVSPNFRVKSPYGEVPLLKGIYEVNDYANEHESDTYVDRRIIRIMSLNGDLDEIGYDRVESDLNIKYGDTERGIILESGRQLDGFCRAIFTGDDYCWETYRRDHLRQTPMIAEIAGDPPLTPLEAAKLAHDVYKYRESVTLRDDVFVWGKWKNYNKSYTNSQSLFIGIYCREHPDDTKEWAFVNKGTDQTFYDWLNDIVQPIPDVGSLDMRNSIEHAIDWKNQHLSDAITFVGHSKGGAEAAANAIRTNRNCYTINPAPLNPFEYNLPLGEYRAEMTTYIVNGEILDQLFFTRAMPWYGERIILPMGWRSYPRYLPPYLPGPIGIVIYPVSIWNHLMPSVINAMVKEGIR